MHGPDGDIEVRARLVVACDGRRSRLREVSGLAVDVLGAPMDVLWFALPRRGTDGDPPLARFGEGAVFVLINRGEHWQCGYVIARLSCANAGRRRPTQADAGRRRPTQADAGRTRPRAATAAVAHARDTQRPQVALQNRVIARALDAKAAGAPPGRLRLISRWHWLRYQTARLLGMSVRPELPRS